MEPIIWTVALMAAAGLASSILLLFVSRKFAVREDERLARIIDILPGLNCGSCGFANCEQYAKALLNNDAAPNACNVGGKELAAYLGVEADTVVQRKAFVACKPSDKREGPQALFRGEPSCRVFSTLSHSSLFCPFSCLGFGDCVSACPFDAIRIENGIAHIDASACTGCGACISICPRHSISLIEQGISPVVAVTTCKNTMIGKKTRTVCNVGCIGCHKCEKVCPTGAVSVADNLSRVDTSLCTGCGACIEACPTGAISRFAFQ